MSNAELAQSHADEIQRIIDEHTELAVGKEGRELLEVRSACSRQIAEACRRHVSEANAASIAPPTEQEAADNAALATQEDRKTTVDERGGADWVDPAAPPAA